MKRPSPQIVSVCPVSFPLTAEFVPSDSTLGDRIVTAPVLAVAVVRRDYDNDQQPEDEFQFVILNPEENSLALEEDCREFNCDLLYLGVRDVSGVNPGPDGQAIAHARESHQRKRDRFRAKAQRS